ncbi:MAG: YczE/YyaS/YitT family protein [Sciscionella sp.]
MALDIAPVSVSVQPLRRLPQLLVGLVLYGMSDALLVRGNLGLDPWDVLHQGVSRHTGLTIGTVSILTGVVVLASWALLRQRPGVGTVCNVFCIGLSLDATLALLPPVNALPVRIGLTLGGVLLNGVATASYIGARLGPGPRDGLMTGISARSGRSIRLVRTGIEVSVLVTGWLLGGTFGVGTVLYAVAIGPLTQFFLPHLTWRPGTPESTNA